MLEHGQSHGPRLPLGQQIFAPHHSLELRELPHHLAHQIVLAEVGCAAGMVGGRGFERQPLQQNIGAPLQPLNAVAQAAEAFREGDPRQLLAAVDAGGGSIGRQEELGIGQPRPQHPLVAAANRGGRRIQSVADAKEAGEQLGARLQRQGISRGVQALQGHIALMGAHHRAEHLGGEVQEALLDGTLDQAGRFDQIHQLLEQSVREIGPGRGGFGGGGDRLPDGGGTGLAIDLDIGGGQGADIGRGGVNHHGIGVESVAPADAIAVQGGIAIGQGDRHYRSIEQGHQPAERTAEAAFAVAPAHEAAALQAPDPGGRQLGQHLSGGPARLDGAGKDESPLFGVPHLQGLGIHAAAAGKSHGGGSRKAIAEGLLGRRALAFLAAILLPLRQILEPQGEPARGPIHPDGAAVDPGLGQIPPNPQLQLFEGRACEIGG